MLNHTSIIITLMFSVVTLVSCDNNKNKFDATGTFEANEVIVSAEASGKILSFNIEEGQDLKQGDLVGFIDSTQLYLSKLQLRENQKAILAGRPDTRTQIEATKKEIENVQLEKQRTENLVKGEVASQRQLDDINSRLSVLEAKLAAQQNSLHTTTSTLNQQGNVINIQLDIVQDQLKRCRIINPINGTVLSKYAMQDEMTAPGKALYKIADLNTIILRAYVSGNQLSQIKLGQAVKLLVDAPGNGYKVYTGTITWVSDKAEFTPKTIQTKEERANLVYAVKINVKNDGYLKLGMYAEVLFK
ncbi:HlyD family secretion protein [Flavihumibacter profundi]|uniref:HlyD family secretion protein n=1 Tax=Flavihumibacter profundi TaxID=2716883 RepID=UPI001CC7086F|nr:HlyD family efflux transporter periplasmic adaptor subunit [Flavihumibacter profundi]MBZ5856837.1 HlyD family efflux transporter periplasmic adaptor subunit [Flavihumibacter profundi]